MMHSTMTSGADSSSNILQASNEGNFHSNFTLDDDEEGEQEADLFGTIGQRKSDQSSALFSGVDEENDMRMDRERKGSSNRNESDNSNMPHQPSLAPPRTSGMPHSSVLPHENVRSRILFGEVIVSDPKLVEVTGFFTSASSYWTYLITSKCAGVNVPDIEVRRRFRHFVALEDRLRTENPGVILPPRPEKHPTRHLEEGHMNQTLKFAESRCSELQTYLKQVIHHPFLTTSPILRQFLTFQNHDIGVTWTECSSSTLTRITTMGSSTVHKMNTCDFAAMSGKITKQEDDEELRPLLESEVLRLVNLNQAYPRIDAYLTLLKELSSEDGATGMELSKLSKDIRVYDTELAISVEIMANGLLRSGRKSKSMWKDLQSSSEEFHREFLQGKNEVVAMRAREDSLLRRNSANIRLQEKLSKFTLMRQKLQISGMESLEWEIKECEHALGREVRKNDDLGDILKQEILRLGVLRKKGWEESLKEMMSTLRDGCKDRVAIWEVAKEKFQGAFPDGMEMEGGGLQG